MVKGGLVIRKEERVINGVKRKGECYIRIGNISLGISKEGMYEIYRDLLDEVRDKMEV